MMVERRWRRGETAGGSVALSAALVDAGASAVDVWCVALALALELGCCCCCCGCAAVVE